MESLSIRRMSRTTRSSNGDRGVVAAAVNRRRIVSEPADSVHNLLSDEFREGNLSVIMDTQQDSSFFWPVVESPGDSGSQIVSMNLIEGGNRDNVGDFNSILGFSVQKKGNQYCDMCDKLADKPERLRQHLTTNHGGSIIDFECDHCGKTFASKTQLNRHIKTHVVASAITAEIDCEKRGRKSQDSESSLSPPSSAQTPSKRSHKDHGEKRFQCLQCSKRFPTSKDLKRHDVVHTGNREFQCSFCSHRFGRKDHRMRHEKKTHAAELQQQQQRQQQSSSPKLQLSPPPPPPASTLSQPLALTSIPLSPPAVVASGSSSKSRTRLSGQRWRHMSSPSTFRHPSSPCGSGSGFLTEIKMEESEEKPAANVVVGKDGAIFNTNQVIVSKASDIVKDEVPNIDFNNEEQRQPPPIVAMMHDRSSYGILRIIGPEDSTAAAVPAQPVIEDDNMNGDLDTLLSDMINESPEAASASDGTGAAISDIDQDSFRKQEEVDASMVSPSYAGSTADGYQTEMFSKSQMIPDIESKGFVASAMATLESNPMMTSVASSAPLMSTSGFKCPPPKLLSDTFTRTKNPVLPSVYIDNSLIVPEPAKQKYHSPHHSLLFESDFMDIDSFLL